MIAEYSSEWGETAYDDIQENRINLYIQLISPNISLTGNMIFRLD